jgi:hypothetical protein
MPPRFSYWTILLDGQATAFRAHKREDLYPTLVQIRRTNPTAELKWFAGGRIWESPEARDAALRAKQAAPRERRGPEWRPGGKHKDPRDRFKQTRDQKRKTFARRQRLKDK